MPPSPATGSALLAVDGLRTSISTTGGVVTAVDGVSLTVGRGETLGIVGESGSGKSVLGRTIMGLYTTRGPVTITGEVRFAGEDIHAMGQRERRALWGAEIGMVFQDPMTALNPVKKVGAHLTETLRRHQTLGRTPAVEKAAELLDLVGIPDPRRRLAQYPHELSGGMRQRVVIAMALANEPALLIADEPTTALDVTVQRQILDLLDTLQSELGMAIILISHNLGVVAGRADRVAVMYAGRLAETAPTDAVFDDPRHPYTHALLGAIPRLEQRPHLRLAAIGGAPPDMVAPPKGCRFAPRCQYAKDDCTTVLPHLRPVPDLAGHEFACHHPVGQGDN
ncbi:dipeptide/oligopeptide/nickel ABC transporter ATP-binding protein [Prauserella marina]|uniref:Peptide/nickel transport system ATP-binding protein n=1 Tax=Prauserella marina TaxID=530584 RepID=A0A222VZG4_9PSEU|nr:ABC transporter ATP-binding protein [Prauserella marina]ASR39336.1 dipeptide/oligopeptide/nickel ABC transporter ATP-binding protein [Prauserella marina]PWV77032.1 peptide/nickel transport system ATP-binding protein [Prauserella marina]SDD02786.1 peptide/nickel transport system ATP-binding protein [Prauserella marina]